MKVGSQPVSKKGAAAKMALVMNYLDILGNMVTIHNPYTPHTDTSSFFDIPYPCL